MAQETARKAWTDIDELEYQMGDMNGIAFKAEKEKKSTKTQAKDRDSGDQADKPEPVEAFYLSRYQIEVKK